MGEDKKKVFEDIMKKVKAEAASDWMICPSHGGQRPRNDNHAFQTKFKGVALLPNGHWGSQIYTNNGRFWLGTFESEVAAAEAYDSASLKLRTEDNHRNFPWTNITFHEPKFQAHHSTAAILDMIKDGSYPSKFKDFLKTQRGEHELGLFLMRVHGHAAGFSCKLLFRKELAQSDVGKLNRLVIPKQYAIKYFPSIIETREESKRTNLCFYDKLMKPWEFQYCYWKSSQSFVFTRGWKKFVSKKGLVAKCTIGFYTCQYLDREREDKTFIVIDEMCNGRSSGNVCVQENLWPRLEQNFNSGIITKEEKEELKDHNVPTEFEATQNRRKSVRLFGVVIN